MKKRCVAMAYGSRPLDRIAVAETDKLIYLLNPQLVDNDDDADTGAVGFPKEFVFEADRDWFSALESAFESGDQPRLDSLWRQGRRLQS